MTIANRVVLCLTLKGYYYLMAMATCLPSLPHPSNVHYIRPMPDFEFAYNAVFF